MTRTALAIAIAAACAAPATAQLVRPDSAVAASEFNGNYDIGNVIDGSGLPAAFTLDDTHAAYTVDNHWTTTSGALAAGNARATFLFDAPMTLSAFHLWNHRSTTPHAADPNYAVTLFDIVLRDADGNILGDYRELEAFANIATAQTYSFEPLAGVRSVDFIIRENAGSTQYTGLAEVAFTGFAVPAPGPLALMATGALLASRRRR